jgi:hypothetical protein
MIYLVLGVLLLCLIYGGRRASRAMAAALGAMAGPRRVWRPTSGLFALILLTLAGVMLVRDAWLPALGCGAAGLALAVAARWRGRKTPPPPSTPAPTAGMSPADARAILGVGPEAGVKEIDAAYRRLMRSVHPDAGGTAGLAAQLNAARDVLKAGKP